MIKSPYLTSLTIFLCVLFSSFVAIGQKDSINQIDETGQRQGYWVHFQKEDGQYTKRKIEEGHYLDDRKEGPWIKYYEDGETPRIKGHYVNNRPKGDFERYFPNGVLSEKGNYFKNEFVGDYWLYYPNGNLKLHNPCGKDNDCDSVYYYEEDGCLTHIDFRLDGFQNIKRSLVFSKTNCNQLLDTVINYESWAASYMWESDNINEVQATRLTYPLRIEEVKTALLSAKGNYLNESTVNFWMVVAAEKNVLPILFELMSDTDVSGVYNKCGTRRFTVGELAFFAAAEIVQIPYCQDGLNGHKIYSKCGGMDKYWHDPVRNSSLCKQIQTFYEQHQSKFEFIPLDEAQTESAYKKKYGVKGKYMLVSN